MYKYKIGGKEGNEYTLVESEDLIVVRTTEAKELKDLSMSKDASRMLPKMQQISAFPEANVTVYQCIDPSTKNIKKVRDEIRETLKQEDQIRFAGRVLKDKSTGTIFIYTENFFIKFKESVPEERCLEIIANYKMDVKEQLKFAKNAYFTTVPEGTGPQIFELSESILADNEEVEYCHPELIREKKNKSLKHPMQWHLRPTSINGADIDQGINIDKAWEVTKGKGIVIAVIDDGIDMGHEEFEGEGKIVAPRDTLLRSDDASPKFPNENHGTACAGVACANGKHQAAGVAPEASLMPIRFGGLGSISEANAFVWAADKGADIISCSWGPADGAFFNPSDPLHTQLFELFDSTRLAINYAIENGRNGKGCVITWAAGNGNENVFFDGYASYEKVIAIAACNDRGKKSVYSDFGDAVWCCFPSNDFFVPLFNHPAPLTPGIWTTDRRGEFGYNPGGRKNAENIIGDAKGHYTTTFGGTSSACPGVAGIVALILSINPDLNWEQVKEILKNSCEKIDEEGGMYDPKGHSIFYGYGRINAQLAVKNTQKTISTDTSFRVNGFINYKEKGNTPFSEEHFEPIQTSDDRILGIKLSIEPFHPNLNIHYFVAINRRGIFGPGKDGEYVGLTDRRRKVIGFAAKLEGPMASDYSVRYVGQFHDKEQMDEAKDGEFIGKASGRGDALVGLKVLIEKNP